MEREKECQADSALSPEPSAGLHPRTSERDLRRNQESATQPTMPSRHPLGLWDFDWRLWLGRACKPGPRARWFWGPCF